LTPAGGCKDVFSTWVVATQLPSMVEKTERSLPYN
jgi:hypothetical protein